KEARKTHPDLTVEQLKETPEYRTEQAKYGTGSDLQRGIQAATAALQGLAGGDLTAALAGASAPELANYIGHGMGIDDNTAAKAIAHAILGGTVAALQGNNAAAGAAGAVTGELAANVIMASLYPGRTAGDLSETEKQTISTLATISAGMAGGIAGDSTASAAAGAQAGKSAAESNSLALVARGCAVAAPCRTKVAEQLLEIGVKAGITGAVAKTLADKLTADELDHLVTLEMMGNDEITSKYLSSLQDKYGSGSASNPNIGKDLTDGEKAELGGAGSGTPGGWEPQDEENSRNSENSKPSQNGSNFTESEINDRITAANKPINNQGMSAAARAWEKHAGRPGGTFEPLTGNPAQKNATAEGFIRDVLNNPNTVRNELSRGGVDYRLPNGQGVRFNSDGSFNTLLDPPVKK
ncbi:VENN motif pre-toxin domain-containing protein, partial [Enterobacter cloacae]|uniref:VENN motif pre-toxin domain-containing protein n=1 Tax=Enterobacter cloacae TaxID=550 RepID=UPI0023EED1E1